MAKQFSIISTAKHPSNLDPTSRLVAGDRECRWSIYSVKGGYVLTLGYDVAEGGRCVDGLFPSEMAARNALTDLLALSPSS